MKKLIAFLLLTPTFAHASICSTTSFYDGYSQSFYGSSIVSGFSWGLDETYLWTFLTNGTAIGFINVPQSTANSFNYTKTPDAFYTQQIYPLYHRPLLTNNCINILIAPGAYLLVS